MPFVLAFRWTERPAAPPPPARPGSVGDVQIVVGTLCSGAGLGVLAAMAFPVPGLDGNTVPVLGVALVVAGALMVWVDPFAPLRHRTAG